MTLDVAKTGFEAMNGEGDVVSGLRNEIWAAVANFMPSSVLAAQHRKWPSRNQWKSEKTESGGDSRLPVEALAPACV